MAPLAVEAGATVPQGAGEHSIAHVTPLFAASLVTATVNWAVPVAMTVAVGGVTTTSTDGIVSVVDDVFDGSVIDAAVNVTTRLLEGGVAGAVYTTGFPFPVLVGETEPQFAAEQDTAQFTPFPVGSLATVAVNCALPLTCTVAVPGATETVMAGTVMVALDELPVSLTEVAVTVTFKSLFGALAGAVYPTGAPLALAAGDTVPHGGVEQDTAQVTPLFAVSLFTVAVNEVAPPAGTVAVDGDTNTVRGGPDGPHP